MQRHPRRTPAAACTCNSNRTEVGKTFQALLIGNIEEQDRFQAIGGEHLHHVRRTAEIVAIEADQPAWKDHRANASHACRSSGLFRAASAKGCPSIATSHAFRMLRTPAAMPPGWPMMPPPQAKMRSAEPSRCHVPS